jgi:hypothetical protein
MEGCKVFCVFAIAQLLNRSAAPPSHEFQLWVMVKTMASASRMTRTGVPYFCHLVFSRGAACSTRAGAAGGQVFESSRRNDDRRPIDRVALDGGQCFIGLVQCKDRYPGLEIDLGRKVEEVAGI